MPHLSLSFLGPFQVMLDGVPVTSFESAKVRALLAYLAVEASGGTPPARPHPREVLAGLLWPDWPDSSALSNLRYALSDLRQCLGDRMAAPSYLLITRESLQFNRASDHELDVRAFEEALSAKTVPPDLQRLEQAMALYRGAFLEGFAVSESAPFEQWMVRKREELERQALTALRHLAGAYVHHGDCARAEACARRHIVLAPEDEEGHRQLMRTLALSGQRSAALAQYEVCRTVLSEELGVEPSRETTALYVQIRDETLSPPPPMRSTALSGLPPFPGADRQPVEVERPPVVARERELARLEQFLARVMAGQGQVAFVTGDPGTGKTTLLGEFARRAMAAQPDLVVVQGNGNAYTGVGDPYLPFLEVLQMLTGDIEARWAGGSLTQEHAQRLWALVPEAVQALLEEGPELINLLIPGPALLARAHRRAPAGEASPAPWLTRLEQLVQNRPPTPSQKELFERTTRVLQALARQHPLLLVLDDLQWADEASLNLLFHLGRKLAGQRILIVGAYRPGEVALGRGGERHPLEPVVGEFQRTWGEITLDMAESEGRRLVDELLDSEPNRLGDGFRETLFRHTGGHALFTVELQRGLKERGDLRRDAEGYWVEGPKLDWEQLPARVEAVVGESLRRLPEEDQALLLAASAEGEEFHAEMLAHVQGSEPRAVIARLSGPLSKQHRLVMATSVGRVGGQRLSRYRFRHYLFQRHLYDSLDEAQRADLHEQVGRALEVLYGGAPCTDLCAYMFEKMLTGYSPLAVGEVAQQLARHFELAGVTDQAVCYLFTAAGRAMSILANQQALRHLAHAVNLLQAKPDTPARTLQECVLQVCLASLYQLVRAWGAPEVLQAAQRAYDLASHSGEGRLRLVAAHMLGATYVCRGKHELAQHLFQEAFDLSSFMPRREPMRRCCLGNVTYWRGQFVLARQWWSFILDPYTSPQGPPDDWPVRNLVGVEATSFVATLPWIMGYPDRARRMLRDDHAADQKKSPPGQRAMLLWQTGLAYQFVGEVRAALDLLEQALPRIVEADRPGVLPHILVGLGWARAHSGRVEEGIANMRQGIADCQATGSMLRLSHFLALLATGYACAGCHGEGLDVIAEALGYVERNDERYYEAEIYRIKGELLLKDECARRRDEREADAEECFLKAIEVAQGQEAKSWELRATLSLARLWQRQGKVAQASEALAAIYGWFTEGFDTPDLVEARELLAEMAQQNGAPQ